MAESQFRIPAAFHARAENILLAVVQLVMKGGPRGTAPANMSRNTHVFRPEICGSQPAKDAGIHRRLRAHPRAWDRRHHGRVLRGRGRAPESAAVRAPERAVLHPLRD